MQQFDLIIVGGGLAGASLALALNAAAYCLGGKSAPAARRGWDARIYAISPANIEFLDSIGAWRHLDAERMVPIRAMEVHGDSGGKLRFRL